MVVVVSWGLAGVVASSGGGGVDLSGGGILMAVARSLQRPLRVGGLRTGLVRSVEAAS